MKYPENGMKPGKFFLTPWGKDVKRNGPYIFDEAGELVWDGTAPPYNYGHAMSFTPFKYQGQDVLALWQGKFSPAGYGDGFGLILDTSYNVVANISATVPGAMMDFHEFSLTDNGTALISVYSTEPYNMTAEFGAAAVNSSEKIMLSYAQEIDIASGEALFTWRSLDHQDPHGCYASPADTNTTKETAWDYFVGTIENLLTLSTSTQSKRTTWGTTSFPPATATLSTMSMAPTEMSSGVLVARTPAMLLAPVLSLIGSTMPTSVQTTPSRK